MRDHCERGARRCGRLRRAGGVLPLAAWLAVASVATTQMTVSTAASAAAETHRVPTRVTPVPGLPDLEVKDGKVSLTLEDAISLALQRNLDVAIERYTRTQSLFGIEQNRGIFDLGAFIDSSVSQSTTPSANVLDRTALIDSDQRSLTFGLDQLTPFGGQASFRVLGSRTSSSSPNALLNPQFGARSSLQFTQPLLRDFGKLATTRPIRIARVTSQISREQLELQVSAVIRQVSDAYWGLVNARDQLQVAEEGLKLAEELHERNKIQVEVGTLAPLELVQSEATVATRKEEIIQAEAAVGDARDQLLELLNLERERYWDLDVEPATDPATEHIDIDLDQSLSTAMEERPEIRQAKLDLQRLSIDSRFFRNQKLPRADLTLSYGAIGLAGQGELPNPSDPLGPGIPLNTDLLDALRQVRQRDFDTWTIGLTVSYPLQNRAARAQSTVADLAFEQGERRLEQVELQVTTDVRTAARAVRTAAQQIESAKISRRLQEKNLDAEQKRYENGMSTSFQITQIQDDVTQARSREVQAITGYRIALARYYQSIGRLLEQAGVELDDGEPATEKP